MKTLRELATYLGLDPNDVHPAGGTAGKIPVALVRERAAKRPRGKLVLVTAMTPTRHGEGKTVTVIGLANGLARIGKHPVACLRQPSLGPTFGVKGGATGGGRSTVEPAAEINLGFTGDIHSVAAAHNLLAALVDNHIFHGNGLGIDPAHIVWARTMDNEDRALRHIEIGKMKDPRSAVHESSFCITAASEVMAILALAKDYTDLKTRLGRILVAYSKTGAAVRASDLKAEGAMTAILRDALEPNLVQTSEGVPAFIHAGPFGNIAHGTCSRLSIELGLTCSDFCVVEAGFASDLGGEKFIDIVTPILGVNVDAAVLVVTQRGLRTQGGASDTESAQPALPSLRRGLENLDQHLQNLATFGVAGVVALNHFPGDSPEEAEVVREFCRAHGVEMVESKGFELGSEGTVDLANAIVRATALGKQSHPVCPEHTPPLKQVEILAQKVYGAAGAKATPEALEDLRTLERIGEVWGPVCVAKTQMSLSDNPKLLNRPPPGYLVTIDRFTRSAGAGFTVAHLGSIELMPGLPTHPASETIDVTPDGRVIGVH
jgi:formate--tetrahydrofolate ligase